APEGAAGRAHQEYVLVVGAAKGEIGGGRVAVRDRHETDDNAAPIDLDNAAETGQRCPQIPLHVVMHAVRPTIAGDKGAGLHRTEGGVGRIFGAWGQPLFRTFREGVVPDPAASKIANRQQIVVV